MPPTVPTRILILSDTHGIEFSSPKKPFDLPPPKVDVVLHCGDLTKAKKQTRKSYQGAIALLASFPAELKLVIAGNHDIALDPGEHAARGGKAAFHDEILALMTGPEAKAAGVTFLTEGLYNFTLKNGAKFSFYTTPYTPLYSTSAFKYDVKDDRFNLPEHIPAEVAATGTVSVAEHPVPDWPNVDIMMTHGPPMGVLDQSKKGTNAGCENLHRALTRARPRLHCFGHVHEGYGAEILRWDDGTSRPLIESEKAQRKEAVDSRRKNIYPKAVKCEIESGRETVMVNAAVVERQLVGHEIKIPWVIELDLPRREGVEESLALEALSIEKEY